MRWLAIAGLVLAAYAQKLPDNLKARIGDFPGTVSLYAKNLDTGATVEIHGSEEVRTASTIKLPIMCAVFDAVARGQAKWSDPLIVTPADKVSGTGVIGSELSDGVQLPLQDVVHPMMVLSDNTATNMILERFGADMVNAYLDRIGITTTTRHAENPGRQGAGLVGSRQTSGKSEIRAWEIDTPRSGDDPGEAGAR